MNFDLSSKQIYSKQRKQFGKSLSAFQGIHYNFADMVVKIELERNMFYKATCLKDVGKSFTKEVATAKYYASEIVMEVSDEAIQIHGGYGYMIEYEVERYLRDTKLLEIGEGTSEIQKLIISRRILGN